MPKICVKEGSLNDLVRGYKQQFSSRQAGGGGGDGGLAVRDGSRWVCAYMAAFGGGWLCSDSCGVNGPRGGVGV